MFYRKERGILQGDKPENRIIYLPLDNLKNFIARFVRFREKPRHAALVNSSYIILSNAFLIITHAPLIIRYGAVFAQIL